MRPASLVYVLLLGCAPEIGLECADGEGCAPGAACIAGLCVEGRGVVEPDGGGADAAKVDGAVVDAAAPGTDASAPDAAPDRGPPDLGPDAGPCFGAPEICNGRDDDCDGRTDEALPDRPCYTGPDETRGVAPCSDGVERCFEGAWSDCGGQRLPGAEQCDRLDNDCDERIDEDAQGCDCRAGETRVCHPGPDEVVNIGTCVSGVQRCGADGLWEICEGAVVPRPEQCDRADDDCDGVVDDGFDFRVDVENCGGCGRMCAPANGIGECRDARCAIHECSDGWQDIDGQVDNGCECEILPEVCDGADNNCNGETDEQVDCPDGQDCIDGACRQVVCDQDFFGPQCDRGCRRMLGPITVVNGGGGDFDLSVAGGTVLVTWIRDGSVIVSDGVELEQFGDASEYEHPRLGGLMRPVVVARRQAGLPGIGVSAAIALLDAPGDEEEPVLLAAGRDPSLPGVAAGRSAEGQVVHVVFSANVAGDVLGIERGLYHAALDDEGELVVPMRRLGAGADWSGSGGAHGVGIAVVGDRLHVVAYQRDEALRYLQVRPDGTIERAAGALVPGAAPVGGIEVAVEGDRLIWMYVDARRRVNAGFVRLDDQPRLAVVPPGGLREGSFTTPTVKHTGSGFLSFQMVNGGGRNICSVGVLSREAEWLGEAFPDMGPCDRLDADLNGDTVVLGWFDEQARTLKWARSDCR